MVLHYTLRCLRFSCSLNILGFVSWPVSITQKNKRLVWLAVGTKLRLKKLPLSGWHYQNKSYPVVEIGCNSSIIISVF